MCVPVECVMGRSTSVCVSTECVLVRSTEIGVTGKETGTQVHQTDTNEGILPVGCRLALSRLALLFSVGPVSTCPFSFGPARNK